MIALPFIEEVLTLLLSQITFCFKWSLTAVVH